MIVIIIEKLQEKYCNSAITLKRKIARNSARQGTYYVKQIIYHETNR